MHLFFELMILLLVRFVSLFPIYIFLLQKNTVCNSRLQSTIEFCIGTRSVHLCVNILHSTRMTDYILAACSIRYPSTADYIQHFKNLIFEYLRHFFFF